MKLNKFKKDYFKEKLMIFFKRPFLVKKYKKYKKEYKKMKRKLIKKVRNFKKKYILKNKQRKKINSERTLSRYWKLLSVFQIVLFTMLSSYAWFAERNAPSIEQTAIQVAAADGLLIKLNSDSELRSVVNLNQVMADFQNFELKQVSSVDAGDFYYVDFGDGLTQGDPQFIKVVYETDGTLNQKRYGYIDYTFYLQAEEYSKYFYIHKDSYISGNAVNAMRVSVSIGATTYIFGNERENGITDPFKTEATIAEGYFTFGNTEPQYIANQTVLLFSDKGGGRESDDAAPIDVNKILGTVNSSSQTAIRVRIWLEGGDEHCLNAIAGTLLDLKLKFGSANVLLAAPAVTPNNSTMQINGLTTSMEYSTAASPYTWISVTDPLVTFTSGQTVYVRIKEVPGVSPESEITTITFS
ncbi:MAG: hypothetical protein JXK08_09415 [Flavobacteriaceae bacterium]|nr:hypothetical protein [Flavobacteriaceae bacterium]